METAVAICKGWEWECPHCGCLNEVEQLYGYSVIKCDECDEKVNVYES